MKRIRTTIISLALALGIIAMPTVPVFAAPDCGTPVECAQKGVDDTGGSEGQPKLQDGIKTIVTILLFILGAIAVIMIIIGGIRYTTSNGDASSIKAAKDTILYAVIGLIVAILAYAIVNFVLDAFGSK